MTIRPESPELAGATLVQRTAAHLAAHSAGDEIVVPNYEPYFVSAAEYIVPVVAAAVTGALAGMLPAHVDNNPNLPDGTVIPIDVTMGALRKAWAATGDVLSDERLEEQPASPTEQSEGTPA